MTDKFFRFDDERIKLLIDNMIDGFVLQTPDGQIKEFNNAALEILGLTENQLVGRDSMDPRWKSVKEDGTDFPGQEHPAMVTIQTKKPCKNVIMGVHQPIGPLKWISINATPFFNSDTKNLDYVLCTFKDITDEYNFKKTLMETNDKLQLAIKAVGLGFFEWDLANNKITADPASAIMYELSPEYYTDVAIGLRKNLTESEQLKLQNEVESCIKEKRDFNIELNIKTAKGNKIIKSMGRVTYDKLGLPTKISGLNKDLTRTRETEMQVLQGARMNSLGSMASGIAHEINNPLAIISAKSQMMIAKINADSMEKSKITDSLAQIIETTKRISKIINGLRSFARDSQKDPFENKSIKAILDDSFALCMGRVKSRNINVELVDFQDIYKVNCRHSQITQIVVNLMNNATDALENQEEKWIKVEVIKSSEKEQTLQIRFTDSGTGIKKEMIDKIFDPFFTTKDTDKGTGLGLSISVGLAKTNNGNLYYDKTNPNTCFVLELPLAEDIKAKAA